MLTGWFAALLLPLSLASAGEVEVLHFWTRGGEVGAVNKLKATVREKGHGWKDFAVADGAGGLALVMLKSRAKSGNPPTAAQVNGAQIQEWARTGLLSNIDDVATRDGWDRLVPKVVSDTMKYQGSYVAVPLNVHRVNWLWINPAALKKANVKAPSTWDEFFHVADAMKRVGIVPVAYNGQAWLDLGTFESVLLGTGGADLYRRAFIERDLKALMSPEMEHALATFKRIKPYTGVSSRNRDWVVSTAMLIRGDAGMQFMGDWIKAEIRAAGKQPGVDILCQPAPGSQQLYTYDIDSFIMFNVAPHNQAAQRDFARSIMQRQFQEAFNLAKGSIPVRSDAQLDGFDDCAKRSAMDFRNSAKDGTLLPSVSNFMVLPSATVRAMVSVINDFWQQDRMTAREAMVGLAKVVRDRPGPLR